MVALKSAAASLSLLLACYGAVSGSPEKGRAAGHTVVSVPKKTVVELELLENLNSKNDETGRKIRFRISRDVEVGGQVVFAGGMAVTGRIKYAERSKPNGKAGTLQVVVPRIPAVNDDKVSLFGELTTSGRHRSSTAAGTIMAVGVVGFALRGRQAFYYKGDVFEVYTRQDEVLTIPGGPRPAEAIVPPPALAEIEASPTMLEYRPTKGNVDRRVTIRLPRDGLPGGWTPRWVELYSVDARLLPEPTPAIEVTLKKTGWEIVFDGWELVRQLKGSPDGHLNEAVLLLSGDDHNMFVRLPVTLKLV